MRKLVFVGGIHGVGKTTICRKFSNNYNLTYLSASEIISKVKKEEFTKSKKIDNIDENQNLLIDALNEYPLTDGWIILDGHFCLLDKNGVVKRIPNQTFVELSPKAIIVFTDNVEKISNRLKERDETAFDVHSLQKFQTEEMEYSSWVAKRLNVPYFVCNPSENIESLYSFVKKCII